jgi:hypothetical protein
MKASVWGLLLLLATVPVPGLAAATPEVAASVVLASGHSSALGADGQARKLKPGDPLHAGDIVNTAAGSYLNMKFLDGAFVLLRPNTRFQIESYHYPPPAAPAPAPGRAAPGKFAPPPPAATPPGSHAFFRLLRGGFRAVTGRLGHGQQAQDEYHVTTPVATIGIRGTDYLVILPTRAEANDRAFNIAGRPIAAEGGVLVGVIYGRVFMRNVKGQESDVGAGQYAMTLKDGTQVRLPFPPDFLRWVPLPDPRQACTYTSGSERNF